MDYDKIGKFIKELRIENKLSQYQLAEKIPISRQAVSKWERGQTIPDSSTLLILSEMFNVSINELLTGKRIEKESIKQLEDTTLMIVDDNKIKTKMIKKIIVIFLTTIILMLLSFFCYYFINSYNSVKIYKVYGQSKNFDIYDGIMMSVKQKSYFKLGKVTSRDKRIRIEKTKLYYKKNNKKYIIIENDKNIDIIVSDYSGYSQKATIYDYMKFINNTYLEITYNNNKKEIIKLNFKKDYTNNKLLFKSNISRTNEKSNVQIKNNITNENNSIEKNKEQEQEQENEIQNKIVDDKNDIEYMMEKAYDNEKNKVTKNQNIDITQQKNDDNLINKNDNTEIKEENEETKIDKIMKNGLENEGNYILSYEEDGNKIDFLYLPMMNQIIMQKNNNTEWTYIHIPKIYMCDSVPVGNPSDTETCKKYINSTLNKYIK